MESAVDLALLGLLAVTAIAVLHLRNLVAVVMLMGIYSFLSAALFVVLDAVDVAFTEVAVGAGVSTILALGTVALVGTRQKRHAKSPVIPLLIVLVTGGMLVYGTYDLPRWGQADNPIHGHVAPEYLADHVPLAGPGGEALEVHIPNIVTTVLASYRGYDTLGETTVVFAAMVGVLILFAGPGGRRGGGARAPTDEDDGGDGAP